MTPQLRLFAVRVGGHVVPGKFYANKREAKAERDRIRENGQHGTDVRVTYGPDHWKRREGDAQV